MRLNWYLPVGRSSDNGHAASPSGGGKAVRIKAVEARPGVGRRWLRKIGPTWAASPLRRLIQAGFFVLFLVIFFYTLRPNAAVEAGVAAQPEGSEFFLMLDPLVSLSTAVAARAWISSLPAAGIILAIGVLVPRSFCGYLCPMGTLIDLFDWAIGRRAGRGQGRGRGWWVNLKYYVLAGILVAALFGVLLSGFFSAIPVLTRGMAFILAPLQLGLTNGWSSVPPIHAGQVLSIALFSIVLGLGLLRPRFWCRYVCPTGAIFSLAGTLRLTERKIEASCNRCGQCKQVCPFDAAEDDFSTRSADCTFCQTCGGVCPKQAIQFAPRWSGLDLKPAGDRRMSEVALSRRGFLVGAVASGVVVVGTKTVLGAKVGSQGSFLPVRPPCSVPEQQFLEMCIRCQACSKACPSSLLQPLGFQQGLEGLWTPFANTDWAGCDPQCHRCGEACSTKAIRAVALEEKQAARMGLSIVDAGTCLPQAGRAECQLCYDACTRAGHEAIELVLVRPEMDEEGAPVAGTGYLAPSVIADKCVGCGLCQSRCHGINVREKGLLARAAIRVEAGPDKEDRLSSGSYRAVREQRGQAKKARKAAQNLFAIPVDTPATQAAPDEADVSAPASAPAGEDLPGFLQ